MVDIRPAQSHDILLRCSGLLPQRVQPKKFEEQYKAVAGRHRRLSQVDKGGGKEYSRLERSYAGCRMAGVAILVC